MTLLPISKPQDGNIVSGRQDGVRSAKTSGGNGYCAWWSIEMESRERAEKRKHQALETAEACIRLLKDRFGARRVILFGSLAGQGPWHDDSDIDLAVEGLSSKEFWQAWDAVEDLAPPGLEVDLVPLWNWHGDWSRCTRR